MLRVAYEIASGPLASTIISEIYDRLLPFVRLYKKISDLPIVPSVIVDWPSP